MLESYFNRKAFSDYYLDKGTILILNGNKLSDEEFAVFRISPIVNLTEEIKVSKKSILGLALHAVFEDSSDEFVNLTDALQKNVLNRLNAITEGYGVSFVCGGTDIFTLAKILQPVVKEENGQDILQQEHDQYYCKAMLLDFVVRLKTKKKKLLLVELPEYGLRTGELENFLQLVSVASLDNVIIYTRKMDVCAVIPKVYNYNVLKNGRSYGFDDYDQLDKQLQNVLIGSSEDEIEKKVLEYVFQSQSGSHEKDEFAHIVDDFLN